MKLNRHWLSVQSEVTLSIDEIEKLISYARSHYDTKVRKLASTTLLGFLNLKLVQEWRRRRRGIWTSDTEDKFVLNEEEIQLLAKACEGSENETIVGFHQFFTDLAKRSIERWHQVNGPSQS
jgi:hypothetical protein